MTREEAIAKLPMTGVTSDDKGQFIDSLVVLGLLKLDPKPKIIDPLIVEKYYYNIPKARKEKAKKCLHDEFCGSLSSDVKLEEIWNCLVGHH